MGADVSWLAVARPLVPALVSLALLAAGIGRMSRWSVIVGLVLSPFIPLYMWAVMLLGAALASILLYTAPIWVTALSPLVAGERPRALDVLAIALGVVGVALVVGAEWRPIGAGVLVGLASGLNYAAYILSVRLAALRGAKPVELGIHSQPLACLGVLAILRPTALPGAEELPWMLYMGVATMLLPYLLNAKALSLLEAYKVSVISLIEPVAATLMASTLLGEELSSLQVAGAALVLLASATSMAPRKPSRLKAAST
jgi:DME family drug/metabolite transporter